MTSGQPLKLGKGVAFVKSQLRRLPTSDETWEADFRSAPCSLDSLDSVWHGLVINHDGICLAHRTLEVPPTVNDLATLLADAMRRSLGDESPHRPRMLRIRARHEWRELLPHLQQIVQQVVSAPRLAKWDKAFEKFSRTEVYVPEIERLYPTVAQWVRNHGWIEIGEQEEAGFVTRALDCGGMIFEEKKARTLAGAMSALEDGLEART